MTTQRIYIVTAKSGAKRLVQATNPAQALRHVASNEFGVQAAKAVEVAQLMSAGVVLEQSRVDDLGGEQLQLEAAET